jgi:hypothetical protein
MADQTIKYNVRISKDEFYNILVNFDPAIFKGRIDTDIDYLGIDPQDTSKILITFAEEKA